MKFNLEYIYAARHETWRVIPVNTLSYDYLSCLWKKGFRNGNWRKLSRLEKALVYGRRETLLDVTLKFVGTWRGQLRSRVIA